jgi:hypothetical protein
MSLPAALECDDALIVFEGPRRVRRRGAGFDLWPDPAEAAAVRERIAAGRPLLVILGGRQAEATALTERYADAPPALAEFVRTLARDLAPLSIPALDWLPHDIRDRGLRFLQAGLLRLGRTPPLLRPALALDERAAPCPHVRFALTGAELHDLRALSDVVTYAFAGPAR